MAMILPILGGLGVSAAGFFGVTLLATSLTAILIGGILIAGAVFMVSKMAQKAAADPGTLVNKNSNDAPIPLIYGERRVGGTRNFMRSAGAEGETTSKEYLHIVFTIAEGPIEEVSEIYFNDIMVWDVAGGVSTSAGPDGIDYSNVVEVNNYLGDQTVASPLLTSRFTEWTDDHVGNGVAYSYIRFRYDRTAFAGLPTVTFLIKGRKVRPVDNLAATPVYSQNPADVVYDYLTHPIYGRDFDETLIDLPSFQDSQTYYNINHSYLGAPRKTINASLNVEETTFNNTQKLMLGAFGALVYTNGEYRMIPFRPVNSTDTITESDIISEWSMLLGDKTSRFNTARSTFSSVDDDYQRGSVYIQDNNFLTEDNGLVLKKDLALDTVTEPDRAKLITYEQMMMSRYDTVVQVTVPHTKQSIEPMDVVTFEHIFLPDSAPTLFRVVQIELMATGNLNLTLQEYNQDVYDEVDPETL